MGVKARARPASERRETPRCGLTKGLVEANGRSLPQDLDMQRQWQRVAARQGGEEAGAVGKSRSHPAVFCVFCCLSVSSVVPPPRPQNPRGFVGAQRRLRPYPSGDESPVLSASKGLFPKQQPVAALQRDAQRGGASSRPSPWLSVFFAPKTRLTSNISITLPCHETTLHLARPHHSPRA